MNESYLCQYFAPGLEQSFWIGGSDLTDARWRAAQQLFGESFSIARIETDQFTGWTQAFGVPRIGTPDSEDSIGERFFVLLRK